MPGEDVKLGPFIGGMNTLSDAAAVAETELIDIVNFELDLDGSLQSRPPIVATNGQATWTQRAYPLLYAVFSGIPYLIVSTPQGIWQYSSGAWALITNTIQSVSAVQWRDKVWIQAIPNSVNPSGNWSPSTGFVTVAAMKKGNVLLAHKERLYSAGDPSNRSLVWFSNPTDGTVWDANNNFKVADGDGEVIIDMVIYNDNIVVFKNNSTYTMAFDTSPTTGVIRKISGTIGVEAKNCWMLYEQNLYVFHHGSLYEVINYDFSRLNMKVPFEYDAGAPSAFEQPYHISIIGHRLVVRYYSRVYVYGFRTRTWSRWETSQYFGPFLREPTSITGAALDIYKTGSSLTTDTKIFTVKDGFDAIASEDMSCRIITKIYDIGISPHYKRLYWWGADVNSLNSVKGTAIPITYVFSVTWGQLKSYTWEELNTWGRLLDIAPIFSTITSSGGGTVRRFVKFLKGLRFRQIQFRVEIMTTGTILDAPIRLFNLTAVIAVKQKVVKGIS